MQRIGILSRIDGRARWHRLPLYVCELTYIYLGWGYVIVRDALKKLFRVERVKNVCEDEGACECHPERISTWNLIGFALMLMILAPITTALRIIDKLKTVKTHQTIKCNEAAKTSTLLQADHR